MGLSHEVRQRGLRCAPLEATGKRSCQSGEQRPRTAPCIDLEGDPPWFRTSDAEGRDPALGMTLEGRVREPDVLGFAPDAEHADRRLKGYWAEGECCTMVVPSWTWRSSEQISARMTRGGKIW
jgi:hypothetical protein